MKKYNKGEMDAEDLTTILPIIIGLVFCVIMFFVSYHSYNLRHEGLVAGQDKYKIIKIIKEEIPDVEIESQQKLLTDSGFKHFEGATPDWMIERKSETSFQAKYGYFYKPNFAQDLIFWFFSTLLDIISLGFVDLDVFFYGQPDELYVSYTVIVHSASNKKPAR